MKTYWGSGSMDPSILDLGTRWRWVVSFTPRPLYPQGNIPRKMENEKQGRNKEINRGQKEKNGFIMVLA
jgi:hypothetical protein